MPTGENNPSVHCDASSPEAPAIVSHPVGYARTPFQEKFGVPRQPGLVMIPGEIELISPWGRAEALAELDGFSHLWVVFFAHQIAKKNPLPQLTVRPPRLGGDVRVGLWASRSLFRPNRLGLSLVELSGIEILDHGRARLHLATTDLVDGTPVLDIKPYLPYAEAIPDARGGFAPSAPPARLAVEWSDQAVADALDAERSHPGFRRQVDELLALDPRPAAARCVAGRIHGMRFGGADVRFTFRQPGIMLVLSAAPASRKPDS